VFDALLEPEPEPDLEPPQHAEIAAAVMSTIILCSKNFQQSSSPPLYFQEDPKIRPKRTLVNLFLPFLLRSHRRNLNGLNTIGLSKAFEAFLTKPITF
jgi:hypothetical protein